MWTVEEAGTPGVVTNVGTGKRFTACRVLRCFGLKSGASRQFSQGLPSYRTKPRDEDNSTLLSKHKTRLRTATSLLAPRVCHDAKCASCRRHVTPPCACNPPRVICTNVYKRALHNANSRFYLSLLKGNKQLHHARCRSKVSPNTRRARHLLSSRSDLKPFTSYRKIISQRANAYSTERLGISPFERAAKRSRKRIFAPYRTFPSPSAAAAHTTIPWLLNPLRLRGLATDHHRAGSSKRSNTKRNTINKSTTSIIRQRIASRANITTGAWAAKNKNSSQKQNICTAQ